MNDSLNTSKPSRIIGMGVCGAGEAQRYMEATLKDLKKFCDDVIIVTCNAGEEEKQLIKKYGFWQYEDNREWGLHQHEIKQDLLAKVGVLEPEWVLALDMDERFPEKTSKADIYKLCDTGEIAWNFLIVNLYNDKYHYVHGEGIQRFWNVRLFKYLPEYSDFIKRPLHCGLAPAFSYHHAWHAPLFIEHYGLMKKEDRERKAERYRQYDPEAKYRDRKYYDDLVADLKPIELIRSKLLEQLRNAVDTQPRKTPNEISLRTKNNER